METDGKLIVLIIMGFRRQEKRLKPGRSWNRWWREWNTVDPPRRRVGGDDPRRRRSCGPSRRGAGGDGGW